jgi:hypothetical protein
VENDFVSRDEGVQRQPGIPKRDIVSFWTVSGLTRQKLRAQRLSSAFQCHLQTSKDFSEPGVLLTEQRKRMLPNTMTKLVTSEKYRKWMDRLAIAVSEEKLKQGIEEDETDGSESEVDDDMTD